jgi:hypothetical protein
VYFKLDSVRVRNSNFLFSPLLTVKLGDENCFLMGNMRFFEAFLGETLLSLKVDEAIEMMGN